MSTRTTQVSNQEPTVKTTTILIQMFLKTIGHTPGKGKCCTDKDGTVTGCQSVNLQTTGLQTVPTTKVRITPITTKSCYTRLITNVHQNSCHLLRNPEMLLFSIAEQVKQCAENLGSISSKKVLVTKKNILFSQKVTKIINLAKVYRLQP